MNRHRPIKFDLMSNAEDSLKRVVDLLAWPEIDAVDSDDARLKHAIVNLVHCIELLLKERLRRVHQAFIWSNVDKYPSLKTETVNINAAIKRLSNIGGVNISENELKEIGALQIARNAIIHYEWHASEEEVKIALRSLAVSLSFVFSFAERELNVDLSREFKQDDAWENLLYNLHEFTTYHSKKVEEKLASLAEFAIDCENCGANTVSIQSEICEFCGHWQQIAPDE